MKIILWAFWGFLISSSCIRYAPSHKSNQKVIFVSNSLLDEDYFKPNRHRDSIVYFTSRSTLIDSMICLLQSRKTKAELLCGYDYRIYLTENDSIKEYFEINSKCGFTKRNLNYFFFDTTRYNREIRQFDTILYSSIKLKNGIIKLK